MSLGLLFSGQGAQRVGLGRSLVAAHPTARALYQQADAGLGYDLSRICFEGPEAELTATRVCQPALFVHGYAVHQLLQERGLIAGAEVAAGLSLGEITALTVAGAFDFATGLRVVAERARLMQEACERTRGGMAAIVGEDPAAVTALCAEYDLDIANLNAPGQIVVSGDLGRLEAAVGAARARGMRKVVLLNVAGAYHSRLMASARDAFGAFLEAVPVATPRLTVLSNTTAAPVVTPAAIRQALTDQVVSTVRWQECLEAAARAGATRFIECGPGAVLAGLVRRTLRDCPVASVAEAAELEALAAA